MPEVHAFTYRVPRLTAEFPIEFLTEDGLVEGRTQNISDTGILAWFAEPVLPDTRGLVRLRFGAYQLEIAAAVAHTQLLEAGLRFCFSSDAEREFAKTLVKLIARRVGGDALNSTRTLPPDR